jgi:uncharacterized alpha-E superfamily protein
MYRKRYGRFDHRDVLEFIVLDRLFPRSIRHCLDNAQKSLCAITGTPADTSGTKPERRLGLLAAEYEYAIIDDIVAEGLHEHLDRLQEKLNDVGMAIYETFFAPRPDPVADAQLQAIIQAAQQQQQQLSRGPRTP